MLEAALNLEPQAQRRMFHPLRVARVIEETHDARSIVFEIPSGLEHAFRYRAGQFLTLEVPLEGVKLRRCYSLASSPDCEDEHKVTVKRVSGGRVSNWLHEGVRAGDVLQVLPPEGRFVLSARDGAIVLFAGGSGITPVISLLKTALATTERRLRLVYANRDQRSIIFADELAGLTERHGARLELIHRLDDVDGFLRPDEVEALAHVPGADDFYLCGPGPFMDTVEHGLLAARAPAERIHVERFVSPPDPRPVPAVTSVPAAPASPDAADVPSSVSIELNGARHEVPYTAGRTLLQVVRDAGIDAPYSCEEGFCGCCAALLVDGKVVMDADDALTAADKTRGVILTCQSRPVGARCSLKFIEI